MNDAAAEVKWNICAEGRAWGPDEAIARYYMKPRKIELVAGKLLDCAEDRETLLCVLLENVGADRAVQFGDPRIWRDAVARPGKKN
jgi:hypothetical protein